LHALSHFNVQVRVRPTSIKKKKPSALDKQYRHVALLQRHNRRQAAQEAQQQEEQQRQQQELADFSQQLRANILAGEGGSSRCLCVAYWTLHRAHCRHALLLIAPTALCAGDTEAVQQTWQPAAAAAALQEQQAAAAQQMRQLQSKLQSSNTGQGMYDLPHLRRSQPPQHCGGVATASATGNAGTMRPGSCSPDFSSAAVAADAGGGSQGSAAAAMTSNDENADDDDVDGFLDGLLQQAAAQKASSSTSSKPPSAAAAAAVATVAVSSRPGTPGSSAAAKLRSTGKQQQQQKGKSKPAWALSEQQQAEAAAAAAAEAAAAAADEAAEERELLQFAEGLSWEQVVGQMDDEQLAAAFQVGVCVGTYY
jgi:hypothetical protein